MADNNYIDNEELLRHLVDYKQRKEKDPTAQIDDYTARAIMEIADRFSRRRNFSGYSFREEFVSDGILNVIQYIDNFDPAKSSNPFSYISQILYYSFIRRIQTEKTQTYVRFKSIQKQFMDSNLAELHEMDSTEAGKDFTMGNPLYDNMQEFIDTYENNIKNSKKKTSNEPTPRKSRYKGPTLDFEEDDE